MNLSTQNEYPGDGGNPPKRRRGGQPGNRNAQKPINTLSIRVHDLKKRAAAAIKMVERRCPDLADARTSCEFDAAHQGNDL